MGFFSSHKTVIDMKAFTLLELAEADDEARRWAVTYANGDMKTFVQMYMVQWRRQYRRSFSAAMLDRYGYRPTATTIRKINNQAAINHINANSGSTVKFLVSVIKDEDTDEIVFSFVDTSNSDVVWKIPIAGAPPLWIEGVVELTPIVMLKKDDVLESKKKRELIQILKKLNLSGDEFWTQLEYECKNYTPPVDDPATTSIDESFIPDDPATPDEDESNLAWCPQAFREPSKIDNAYVFVGLYPYQEDMGAIGGLFETFKLLSGGGGTFNLSMNEIYTGYVWDAKTSFTSGILKDVNGNHLRLGDYQMENVTATTTNANAPTGGPVIPSSITGATGNGSLIYKKQVSKTTYESIEISNFEQTWGVIRQGTHHLKTTGLTTGDDPGEELTRMIVPLDVWNGLKFKYWTGTYEMGLTMFVFAHEKTKLKWYQRGIFRIIMFVVMIVVSIIVPGGAITMQAIVNAVINSVIAAVVGMVVSSLSPELALIVGIVMMVWGAGGGINFDISNLTNFNNFLPMVNKAVDTYNKIEEIQIASATQTEKEATEKIAEENDAVVELMKDTQGPQVTLVVGDTSMTEASSSPGGQISPEDYFAQKYGNAIYDFDLLFDVDFSIDQRKDVKAG